MKSKYILLFLSIMSIHLISQSAWKNPSEKYIYEYKKYENAKCPIKNSRIQHFVYFIREREEIKKHPFLYMKAFAVAQIMYSWKQLEPQKGKYDFSFIEKDIKYLLLYNKKLFIQIQDATFYPQNRAVPNYIISDEYNGGVSPQIPENKKIIESWVAKRWNNAVQERFALLLYKLGQQFDKRIEGINLQETAIEVTSNTDASFNELVYVRSIKKNMLALAKAFPHSVTLQYVNFMPGEWLPWEDKGYIRSIYKYGEEIEVGLGASDLMPQKIRTIKSCFYYDARV